MEAAKLPAKAGLRTDGVEGKAQVVDDHARKNICRETEAVDQTSCTIQEAEAGLFKFRTILVARMRWTRGSKAAVKGMWSPNPHTQFLELAARGNRDSLSQ